MKESKMRKCLLEIMPVKKVNNCLNWIKVHSTLLIFTALKTQEEWISDTLAMLLFMLLRPKKTPQELQKLSRKVEDLIVCKVNLKFLFTCLAMIKLITRLLEKWTQLMMSCIKISTMLFKIFMRIPTSWIKEREKRFNPFCRYLSWRMVFLV